MGLQLSTMKFLASSLFLLLLVLQIKLWFGSHGVFQLWALQRTTQKLQDDNDRLEQRNDQLYAEVLELQDGKEALEERARSHLGFIKEGEKFYRAVPKARSDKLEQ